MSDKDKKIDVDFNEALRRIAHTPKELLEESLKKKEPAPSTKDDAEKVDKQSYPSQ